MPKITVKVTIVFGRASQGCARFSLCKAHISGSVNASVVAYDSDKETMDISVPVKFIEQEQPDKVKYFEGQDSVTFEEEFTFPSEIQEKLKAKHPLIIPEGQECPLSRDDENYIIKNIPVKG